MAATISANSAGGGGLVTSGDASGVLALQTAGVTALSIDASQKVTFANSLTGTTLTGATFTATPATTTPQSMVRVNIPNGYGSTNTDIQRYTTTVVNQGSDITYADSATLGGSFTINTSGVYAVSLIGHMSTGNAYCGVSLNSSQLTTAISAITLANVLAYLQTYSATALTACSWTGYVASGGVVRVHNDASVNGARSQFTIVRIA